MRVLGIDFETTGLDVQNDRVTEVGMCLWETDTNTPLMTWNWLLYDDEIREKAIVPETAAMMKRVSGLTVEMLAEFGEEPTKVFEEIATIIEKYDVPFLVAHNASGFDKLVFRWEMARHLPDEVHEYEWIDTKTDLPFEVEPDSRRLKHLACDQGFINPFPHRALFDVMAMLKVMGAWSLSSILEYRAIPSIVIRACVSYDDRQLAKDLRFSWEKIDDKTYDKCWVKKIKEDKLDKEIEAAKGRFVILRIA